MKEMNLNLNMANIYLGLIPLYLLLSLLCHRFTTLDIELESRQGLIGSDFYI